MNTGLRQLALALSFTLSCVLVLAAGGAQAQVPTTAPAATAPAATADALGRDTPAGMVSGFLEAAADQNYELAAQYLNMSQEGAPWGPRRARQLQRILDKGGYVNSRLSLSSNPAGEQNDRLAPNEDTFGSVRTDGGNVDLIAERISAPNGGGQIWLVSVKTVGQLESLSEKVVASFLDENLPRSLRRNRFAGAPIGHWLAIVVLAFLSYGVAWIFTCLANLLVLRRRLGARVMGERLTRALAASLLPIRVFLAIWILWTATILVGVSIVARQELIRLLEIVGWIVLAWIVSRIVDALTDFAADRMTRRGRLSVLSAIAFGRRSLKVAIVVLAGIAALSALGFNVTTGLAALGIGGIAIALGAQKTIENFVGSLTLIADQPVRVGDVCRFGDTLGTVEDIGMRSTRIRTLARTVVSIPNGQFASMQIENYTRRDKFWLNPTLDLRYETTASQLRSVIDGIHETLVKHTDVYDEPVRVRWVAFGTNSLRVEIFAYVAAKDQDTYLRIQEELFLKFLEVIEDAGTALASPSPTLVLTRDAPAAATSSLPQTAAIGRKQA